MVYIYMIITISVFYLLVGVSSLFGVRLVSGDDSLYLFLLAIIGILLYIADKQKKSSRSVLEFSGLMEPESSRNLKHSSALAFNRETVEA